MDDITQLKMRIKELEAQLVYNYHFAEKEIDKCSEGKVVGSGVILELTFLGGKKVIDPVCIRDGLTPETIKCLKSEFSKSYKLSTLFKPTLDND